MFATIAVAAEANIICRCVFVCVPQLRDALLG